LAKNAKTIAYEYSIMKWVNTYRYIFSGMNIHLLVILMFTRGIRFWHNAKCQEITVFWLQKISPLVGAPIASPCADLPTAARSCATAEPEPGTAPIGADTGVERRRHEKCQKPVVNELFNVDLPII